MKKNMLQIESFSSLELISFKKYNPIHLLWIGIGALVIFFVLQLCSPPSLLVSQITNIVETITYFLAFSGITLLVSHKPTRAQWFFIFILGVYIAWVTPCLTPALFIEKLDLSEIVANPFLRILDGLLFMSIILYSIETLRPHYLKCHTILKIASLLLFIPVLGIISNYLKNEGLELMATLIYISRMLLIVGYPLVILIYLLKNKKTYKQWSKQKHANLEKLDNLWLKYYTVTYFFMSVAYCSIMPRLTNESLLILHTMFPLFFVLIFPFVLHQQEFVEYTEKDEAAYDGFDEQNVEERQTYNNSSLMYKKMLIHWMEQEKPYLNSDFRLVDIIKILPLNRKYISRLLNEEIGETFFSFVMKYRIEESISLLKNRHDLTITQIATKSGFSSPSVFGRSFLKEKGITPLEYRKQHILTNK